jgi:hypothetical protein
MSITYSHDRIVTVDLPDFTHLQFCAVLCRCTVPERHYVQKVNHLQDHLRCDWPDE